jgi:membrane-associated phospholipid phosphatase
LTAGNPTERVGWYRRQRERLHRIVRQKRESLKRPVHGASASGRRSETVDLSSLAATVLVLGAVTALVATGASSPFDRYSTAHWMPELTGQIPPLVTWHGLALPDAHGSFFAVVLGLWSYPASFVASAIIVAALGFVLHSRRGTREALLWCSLLVLGNLVELIGKLVITRPTLRPPPDRPHLDLHGFDHSFPSGHTIRAVIVAAAVAYTWPRTRRVARLWAITAALALIPLAEHVPTDVLGGLLAAGALLLAARGFIADAGARAAPLVPVRVRSESVASRADK